METTGPREPYGSFDSVETAKTATGGRVYECRGHEGHAIIVEDRTGRNWLYVRPESPGYRDAANAAWGGRMSADGKDADHVASRGIEAQAGQGYVLMGAVDSSANRSHGSYEAPGRHLDRPFNRAASRTREDQRALPLSERQAWKVTGTGKRDIERDSAFRKRNAETLAWKGFTTSGKSAAQIAAETDKRTRAADRARKASRERQTAGDGRAAPDPVAPRTGDPRFDEATFGGPEQQANLEDLKGRELCADLKAPGPPDMARRYDGPGPWKREAGPDPTARPGPGWTSGRAGPEPGGTGSRGKGPRGKDRTR